MRELLRTIVIFVVIVLASFLGACAMYDIRPEDGLMKFYDKTTLPTMPVNGLAMVIGGPTPPPVGHYDFCLRFVADCSIVGTDTRPTPLTQDHWAELVKVNNDVNRAIVPVNDIDYYKVEEHWTYPEGYGDCEDYVIAKRADLMRRGWPASSLLIAMAVMPGIDDDDDGLPDGHAVLVVRTDQGDYVLDNLNRQILAWYETAYRYTTRQSINHAKKWTVVVDTRVLPPVVAATN